jgi:hypothetical protein
MSRIDNPSKTQNLEQWENHCRKIHARAADFLADRMGLIEVARSLSKLATWTELRDDPDLEIFLAIDSETALLPVGDVRKLWSSRGLEREDVEIDRAEKLYGSTAREAATRLVERFAWAVEARNTRRNRGGGA